MLLKIFSGQVVAFLAKSMDSMTKWPVKVGV
jgi:hypothetical protein